MQRISQTLAAVIICALVQLPCDNATRAVENEARGQSSDARAKKVLMIGIDGLRSDALRAAKTPFLDELVRDGTYADDTQILGARYQKNDTVSGPGWSSILTGVWADKHQVHGNAFKSPNFKDYPHFFRRIKDARPDAQTVSFVTWGQIDKFIVDGADVSKVMKRKDSSAEAYAAAELELANEAKQYLTEKNPDAMFVYFGHIDIVGHSRGFHPRSRDYLNAIALIDRYVGIVLQAMTKRKTFKLEDWLVVITTDHGGKGGMHKNGHNVPEIRNVFLIVSGPSADRGKIQTPTFIVDAPVTALAHLSIPLEPSWNLDGRPVGLKTRARR